MATPQGVIRVQQRDQTMMFQAEGRLTLHESGLLRHFLEALPDSGIKQIHIDLSRCSYLDSTFLGTLLYLQRWVQARVRGQLILACPSPACRQLLRQMRLDQLLPIVESDPVAADPPADDERAEAGQGQSGAWIPLEDSWRDRSEFQRNIVEAHQELAEVGGPMGETFREVAAQLARELEAKEKPLPPRSS